MNNTLLPMTHKEQAIGWPYLLIQLFFLPVIVVFADYLLKLHLSEAMLNVVLFTLDFILILVIFHRFLLEESRRALKIIPKVLGTAVIGYLLYMTLAFFINIAVVLLQPEHVNANDAVIGQMAQEQFWLMATGTVLLVPITEETLFRGLLFGTLYRKKPVLGYVVSTIIFAAIHVIGYVGFQDWFSLLVSLLQYLPAGLALGWAYARSGTLWCPILIHAFINFIAMAAMR